MLPCTYTGFLPTTGAAAAVPAGRGSSPDSDVMIIEEEAPPRPQQQHQQRQQQPAPTLGDDDLLITGEAGVVRLEARCNCTMQGVPCACKGSMPCMRRSCATAAALLHAAPCTVSARGPPCMQM